MPDRHLPGPGWTRKVQTQRGASAAREQLSLRPLSPSHGVTAGLGSTRTPAPILLPPRGSSADCISPQLCCKAEEKVASPHLILLWLSKVCIGIPVARRRSARVPCCWREGRPCPCYERRKSGHDPLLGNGTKQGPCHQLTGLPKGLHGAGSQGEALQVLTPPPTAKASRRWLLAALDMNPPAGVWQREYGVFQAPGPVPALEQPAAYLFIHLLLPVPPAW